MLFGSGIADLVVPRLVASQREADRPAISCRASPTTFLTSPRSLPQAAAEADVLPFVIAGVAVKFDAFVVPYDSAGKPGRSQLVLSNAFDRMLRDIGHGSREVALVAEHAPDVIQTTAGDMHIYKSCAGWNFGPILSTIRQAAKPSRAFGRADLWDVRIRPRSTCSAAARTTWRAIATT